MAKNLSEGAVVDLKFIDPLTIEQMQDDDIVIVNRIRLNALLVELRLQNKTTDYLELLSIIRKMKQLERTTRRFQVGAEMRVGDIKRLFPALDVLPRSSFANVDE